MKTLSKRGGSRDVMMTRNNMMILFNLLKRLIDEAKFLIVGSPFSIITLLKINLQHKIDRVQDNLCIQYVVLLYSHYHKVNIMYDQHTWKHNVSTIHV